jgi:hypothetical protein
MPIFSKGVPTMPKRPIMRNLFLGLILCLSLFLAACGGAATPTAPAPKTLSFKTLKEIEVDASVSQVFVGLFALASSNPGGTPAPAVLPTVKFYISDEADQDKLATEIDGAITGLGYKFDFPQQPTATKPFKQGANMGGSYSKSGAVDYVFSLSATAELTSPNSIEGFKIFGITEEAAKKFVDQVGNSKSIMLLISANGLIKSLGSGGATGTGSGSDPNSSGVAFSFVPPKGIESVSEVFFINKELREVFAPKVPSSALFGMYSTDLDEEAAAKALDAELQKNGWQFSHPSQTAPFKVENGFNGYYKKTGEPELFIRAMPSTEKAAELDKALASASAGDKEILTKIRAKKTYILRIVSNKLLEVAP